MTVWFIDDEDRVRSIEATPDKDNPKLYWMGKTGVCQQLGIHYFPSKEACIEDRVITLNRMTHDLKVKRDYIERQLNWSDNPWEEPL
jgi:hypothetical protein